MRKADRRLGRPRSRRISSRQALVAIRYSQARNVARPVQPARERQARSNASCSASSACSGERRIRTQWA
jgi:hypothetical protein